MSRYFQGAISALFLVTILMSQTGGWTSHEKLSGNYKSIQQITATGTIYFPKIYPNNSGPRTVADADSAQSVKYASIMRLTGTGTGTFVLNCKSFPAANETVFVGDTPYQFSGDSNTLTSIECVALGSSTYQIEGMN